MRWKCPVIRARLSLGLVATFLGLLAILHFLEPELNSGYLISEYLSRLETSLAPCCGGSRLGSTVQAWGQHLRYGDV
jgi:hypothetical protein